jgi:1-acyl-sn-glycerol-3-phosphate acyltransferase
MKVPNNRAMSLTNSIGYLARLLVAVFLLLPWVSIVMLVGLIHREIGFDIGLSYARFFHKLFGLRVHVENENKEPLRGCVFILLNQTSLLDGLAAASTIPRPWRVITNIEYAMIPFFGWVVALWGHVIVRQWPAQAKKAIEKLTGFLTRGGNVWMSIEGRRSKDGQLSPYKNGSVVLAIQAKAAIVPVVHLGVRECLPYGEWRIRPGDVTIRFLRAVPTRELQYEDRMQLIEKLRGIAERELGLNERGDR